MATDMKEAVRRLIYRYVVEGADDVLKTQEKITQQTTQTDKASLSLEKAFSGLERKYVDTVRAQQDYEKVQKKVNDAVAQNPALQERANAVLAAAKDKFDSVAAGAGKAGSAATILSKAISVIIGPAGLVGVAMTAVGTAAGYMWSKFADQSAITTVEQALEEQNRLLKEAKLLIDAKTSAEAKAGAQSRGLTEFQIERSQRDLQGKIGAAQEAAAIAARARSTTPTQVAGEMGEAPTGVAALGPGYDKIADAVQKLNAAMAAGKPGLAAFQEELAKVGRAYPELAQTAEELIKIGASGMSLEQAQLRLKAISDALKGIATDAQLAAVGLGSVAQFKVNNMKATEAAEATERQAKATLTMAAAYPGMTIAGATQLQQAQLQTQVTGARAGAERLIAQEKLTQNTLIMQGMKPAEAMTIAAEQRRGAEAAATLEFQNQLATAQLQTAVASARNVKETMIAQEILTQKTLMLQGLDASQAAALAAEQRAASEAQVKKAIDQQIKSLDEQLELLRATTKEEEASIKARHAYTKAIEQGATAAQASQIEAKTLAVETERLAKETENLSGAGQTNITVLNQQAEAFQRNKIAADALWDSFAHRPVSISWPTSGAPPVALDFMDRILDASGKPTGPANQTTSIVNQPMLDMWEAERAHMKKLYGEGGYTESFQGSNPFFPMPSFTANDQGAAFQNNQLVDKTIGYGAKVAFDSLFIKGKGSVSEMSGLLSRLVGLVEDPAQKAGMLNTQIAALRGEAPSIARDELIKGLMDQLKSLTDATNSLENSITQTLSPYYSQDPRTTKLGFRAGVVGNPDWMLPGASNENPLMGVTGWTGSGMNKPGTAPEIHYLGGFASGGEFTVPGGYSQHDNQMVAFAARSGETVSVSTPEKSKAINIDNRIIIQGNVDPASVDKIKRSQFQQAQRMRGMISA